MITSLLGGILPIPGRVALSAPLLDAIAPPDKKKRSAFGVIDYLSTHHYYWWSPLEKTVVLPMADPDEIAETYLQFHSQHRSAWAWEMELRPWVETF